MGGIDRKVEMKQVTACQHILVIAVRSMRVCGNAKPSIRLGIAAALD